MGRPDFIIAGASRSGTTSLHTLLSRHPAIFMSQKKEIQFFWRTELFRRGREWYEGHFPDADGMIRRGESSPPYFHRGMTLSERERYRWDPDDDPATRMAEMYPEMKLIFTLRSPVTRVHSQFWKNRWQRKEEVDTFEEAVELELRGARRPESHGLCWLYRNHYAEHLSHWLSRFSRRQILVLIFEEWIADPAEALTEIEDFLGVPHDSSVDDRIPVQNSGRSLRFPFLSGLARLERRIPGLDLFERLVGTREGNPELTVPMREKLTAYFRDDVRALEEILDRRLDCWDI